MKKYLELIIKALFAGVLIGLAACIFVGCKTYIDAPWGKILGAALFSIGLISVILLDAYLFTGKIGYVDSEAKLADAFIGLFFNLVGAFIIGLIYRGCFGIQTIMDTRLVKTWYQILLDGVGCGALIYLAVELFKHYKSLLVIILPVMAFILANFEHSIATMAFFGMCNFTWLGFGYIILIILGNAIGSLALRWLQIGGTKLLEQK